MADAPAAANAKIFSEILFEIIKLVKNSLAVAFFFSRPGISAGGFKRKIAERAAVITS